MSSPHDALFRHTFGQPEHAAGLFKARLPAVIAEAIDWSSLTLEPGSFVDDNLTWRHSDLLFRANLHDQQMWLYLLVEHQSTPHPLMPARMLIYITRLWSELLRNDPKLKRLPPVFPLVVYHGAEAWTAPTQLLDVIDLDEALRAALARYLPAFHIDIEDLSSQTDAQLRARAYTHLGTLTVLCLQRLQRSADPLADLGRWMDVLVAVTSAARGIDALTAILHYLFEVAEPETQAIATLLKPLGKTAEVAIMTTAEKLRELGRTEGRAEGEARGRTEGRTEGESRGRAATLLKLLQLKFGPVPDAVVVRVQSATIDELDHWAERILDATSTEDTLQ